MKKISSLTASALLFLPMIAGAQKVVPNAGDTVLSEGARGIEKLIIQIGNWLFTILLVLAVVFILLAAYKYLTSGGGDEVGKAHKMLLYAAVAIAVAFLARGVVFVVEELVTDGSTGRRGGDDGVSGSVRYRSDDFDIRVGF